MKELRIDAWGGGYQAYQPNQMKDRYKNIKELHIGMVVKKVESRYRTRTNIRRIFGVIICASESDTLYNYGICTRHGILSSRRKIIMYTILSFALPKKVTLSDSVKEIKEHTERNKLEIDILSLISV